MAILKSKISNKHSFVISIAILTGLQSFVVSAEVVGENSNKHYSGAYLGTAISSQKIFSGAFIDNTDVLAEGRSEVLEIYAGWRIQWGSGWVIGAELQWGALDGDLRFENSIREVFIDYSTSDQYGLGGILGHTFGKNQGWLGYVYVNEITRDFDVRINTIFGEFRQNDEQGALRYGIGLERQLNQKVALRASVGTLKVDFGGVETNIEGIDGLEWSAGLNYQF